MRCPGQDLRFWKPNDIFEFPCPKCGQAVEFFKDDVRRRCRCGHEIVNPRMDFGCAGWCPYAEQCVGAVPEEAKARHRAEQKGQLKERIGLEVKKYLGTDFKRLKHAIQVARYAERILKHEGGHPLVVLGAAYLHTLGGHEEKKKDGPPKGALGVETSSVARKILEGLGVEKDVVDEICDLVAQPLEPQSKETLNVQILHEAHWLADIAESGVAGRQGAFRRIVETSFRTETGKRLADELCPGSNGPG